MPAGSRVGRPFVVDDELGIQKTDIHAERVRVPAGSQVGRPFVGDNEGGFQEKRKERR